MPTKPAPIADLTGLHYKRDTLQCPRCGKWGKSLYAKDGKLMCQECVKGAK